jgi:hypothetical protein
MSSLAYGALTRKRAEAPKDESTSTAQPGLKTYVDTLAALVPAEVLAIHSALFAALSEKKGDELKITDPGWLEFGFYAMIVLSAIFYVAGYQKKKWNFWTVAGAAIPPLAFIGWTMALQQSALDAAWDLSDAGRQTLVIIGTPLLVLVAGAIPFATDKSAPLPK